ncbi:MAG: hypothetical protein WEA04_03595 [Candidatus Andersenbacteria bacterium]
MIWLFLALGAHLGNALVLIVDKSLLSGKSVVAQPLRYTFYSAVITGGVIVFLPFVSLPWSSFILGWALVAGGARIVALWLFFTALKATEATRVVPLTGSAVALFTVIIAMGALGEIVRTQQFLAIVLLLAGGALLSLRFGHSQPLPGSVKGLTLGAGLFFAFHFVIVKYLYDATEAFLPVFIYSRLIEAAVALIVLGPLVLRFRSSSRVVSSPKTRASFLAPVIFVSNKVLAGSAFLLQHYAISLGSVAIVNALQGMQYIFLLILAAAISYWLPGLWREELGRVALMQKFAGILCVAAGLGLIV